MSEIENPTPPGPPEEVPVEPQVQRYLYADNGGFVASHVGTKAQFDAWIKDNNLTEGLFPEPTVTRELVNAHRNSRVDRGLPFNGKIYDFDQRGKDNITGAAALAKFALFAGAQPGDYKWHVTDPALKDAAPAFSWITQDNTSVELDAPTMSALGDAAAAWESAHVFAARVLKDMDTIPLDYEDDKYWP